jgi:RNA polymerase sigma factor (sigma-70 family)
MITDSELLRRYGESRCEAAFTELVHRYIDFVYSAARRQVAGDAHLARDVTQRVFIKFAQKALSLSPDVVLSGWLYTTTRYAAAKAIRTERRWRAREEKAMELLSPQEPSSPPPWQELQPVLDSVMHELNERDRNAVLLRYFEGRPLAEVGTKLGLSEDAARMRLGRALEKLRQLLARRGVTSTTTAALAGLLAQQTVSAAPAGLAVNVAGAALASVTTVGTSATIATIMTAKIKIALVSAAVIAVATPLALQYRSTVKLRQEVQTLRMENQQLAAVSVENARLSNLLAEASARPPDSAEPSVELLKLRGEVARLRDDSRELARLQTAAANSGHDPSIQATLQTLAARATQLKRHLEQAPHTRIPELQLVTDKEWIDAVAKNDLENDAHVRQALSSLRSSAKGIFGKMLQKALKQYTEANGGMLPADISQLQPYLNPPVDPSMLQRYQLVQSGNLADTSPNNPLIAEVAPPVDEDYDTRFDFRLNGSSSRSVSRSGELLQAAAEAYAGANNGLLPRAPGDLLPYLRETVDATRIQKFLAEIPPNVRTLDQIKKR